MDIAKILIVDDEQVKKTRAVHPDTDILIISAWDSQPVASEVLEDGAIDYITKPSTINVIYSKVC